MLVHTLSTREVEAEGIGFRWHVTGLHETLFNKNKEEDTTESSLGPISPAGHNQHTDKSHRQDRGHSVTARTPCASYAIVSFLLLTSTCQLREVTCWPRKMAHKHLSHKPETWVPSPRMASVIPELTEPAKLESCLSVWRQKRERFSFAIKQMEKIHFLRRWLPRMVHGTSMSFPTTM